MVDRFIDTGGIVDDHHLNKLSLHNVLLLEMPFRHGYCLFVLYPHPSDLSMSVGNNIIDASRDLIISIRHNITYLGRAFPVKERYEEKVCLNGDRQQFHQYQ
jgi:hypothetical protein